jgi:hypothetical protein
MARRKTLGKYYYKNRQKNYSKKANNRRSVKKRTIGGMLRGLRNLVTRRRTNAAGNSADNDPFPARRELPIENDRGRRYGVLNRIPGVSYMTSGIRGSSVPAVPTSAVYIAPGVTNVAEVQDIILKDKIWQYSFLIRAANDSINDIFESLPRLFVKLADANHPDIKTSYMTSISHHIHNLPLMEFPESQTQKNLGLLAKINSNVILYIEKLANIMESENIPYSQQEYAGLLDIIDYLNTIRQFSGHDNFTTTYMY